MSPSLAERIYELRFLLNSSNPFKKAIGAVARVCWMTFRTSRHPLGRGRVMETIGLSYFWQIWRRMGRSAVVRLPEGSSLLCPPWSRMAGNYVTVGFDEYTESLFVLDYLKPGEQFVDVGANIGFYAIIAAGNGGRVIAFEPIERARRAIAESAKLNGRSDEIVISPRALSDWSGTSFFTTGNENMNSLTSTAPGAIEVEVSTLDREVSGTTALIKIDAEGFDLTVLRGGAERVLPIDKPAIVVELQDNSLEIRDWLEAHDYALFRYNPAAKTLVAFVPHPPTNGAPFHEYVVAIHRDRIDETRARLAASPHRVLSRPAVRWAAPLVSAAA